MGNNYVQLPADSTGKKLQTWDNVVGANTVHAEAMVLVDSTGAEISPAKEAGGNLATIAGDTTSIDGKITACNTGAVTVSAALPAGANAIGKLAANSGVDIGDVDVTSVVDTSSSLDHGSNLDVDTAAEQITSTSFTATRGVLLKADNDNSGILYIGNSDVTDGDTAATDGIPLKAGEWIVVPVDNPNRLYAIGSVANQKIYWMAV